VTDRPRRRIAEGLGYLEAARWHRGALWFSDIREGTVNRLSPDGEPTVVARVPGRPSGLGFEPDGTPIVVSIEEERLVRLGASGVETVADLSGIAFRPNDMAVDREGRAYVTQLGYDIFHGGTPKGVGIVVRHPDGRLETCGRDLFCPNGITIAAGGRTLVTAESFATPKTRLTAFEIADGGALVGQRVFAEFGSTETDVVDGIAADVEGAIWVSFPFRGEFRRVLDGGRVTDVIRVPPEGGNLCIDCVLGGPEMRTLFLLVADSSLERLANGWDSTARIEAVDVDVPGVRLD
jgi:sugar lactone lactonase YvrE